MPFPGMVVAICPVGGELRLGPMRSSDDLMMAILRARVIHARHRDRGFVAVQPAVNHDQIHRARHEEGAPRLMVWASQ